MHPAVSDALEEIPRNNRQNMRSTAVALGVPLSSFHRLMKKDKAIVKHSSALKPVLTDANKQARIDF